MDDDGETGEWIRLRADEFVIGRSEGDLCIPHDDALSGRHLRIFRKAVQGRSEWHVQDLQSTNGTFVRASTGLLRQGQELLIGTTRFRFEAGLQDAADSRPSGNATRGWQTMSADALQKLIPSLVEMAVSGEERRYAPDQNEQWIGQEAGACRIAVTNDPFVSPRHAQVVCAPDGRWQIRDNKSRNGTWLRIKGLVVRSVAEFQIGEQRLLLRIGSENPEGRKSS